MFTIDKLNKIRLTKGDTATMKLDIYDLLDQQYTIQSTDTIVMTVKLPGVATAVLTKTLTSDGYFIIEHSDTSALAAGFYSYDVQLTTSEGNVYTVIPTSFFELTNEVSS